MFLHTLASAAEARANTDNSAGNSNPEQEALTLSAAFVAFQAELRNPKKDLTGMEGNRSYKYADLAVIADAVRPILQRYGLAYMQPTSTDGNVVTVRTKLVHTSGEVLEADPLTWPVASQSVKALGATITYLRRYSLCALLGISAEEDSDGTTGESKNSTPKNSQQAKATAIAPLAQMSPTVASSPAAATNAANSKPMPGKPFDFGAMVEAISALKERVGEKFYYSVLRSAGKGAEHANKIRSREVGLKVYHYLLACSRILDQRERIGDAEYFRVLGAYGYEKPQDIIDPQQFMVVLRELESIQ